MFNLFNSRYESGETEDCDFDDISELEESQ